MTMDDKLYTVEKLLTLSKSLKTSKAIYLFFHNVNKNIVKNVASRQAVTPKTFFKARCVISINDALSCVLESQGNEKTFRRNWARLIQKIYEVDSLVYPKCQASIRIISSVEDPLVIWAMLDHLGIWLLARSRPPPKSHAPPGIIYTTDDLFLHSPPGVHVYGDPEYFWDDYIQS